MSSDPILILQLQRLGDLILSFPLLLDLKYRFPETPIWIASQPEFFKPLMAFTPNAVFFPPSHLPQLGKEKYSAVINLGSRKEAALCASQAEAPLKTGLLLDEDRLRINGFWQLYRASLTQNNRHNAFHWADLNRLDLGFPLPLIGRTPPAPSGSGRIGLFIGASEPEKRPDIHFWVMLARRLSRDGFRPILLGGPTETEAGLAIAGQTGPIANFCGKTSLIQLGAIIRSLDLLITPDTGPMHLADWLGKPVLNISMGNVHAIETGPCGEGQWVVRARMSCVGCWQCSRPRLYCKNAFHAPSIASLAASIAAGSNPAPIPGLEILQTARAKNGLYALVPTHPGETNAARLLENFWQAAFLYFCDASLEDGAREAAMQLAAKTPRLAEKMRAGFGHMLAAFAGSLKRGEQLPDLFWKSQPFHSRLFAGHAQMSMQNDNFSRASMSSAVRRVAALVEIFSHISA